MTEGSNKMPVTVGAPASSEISATTPEANVPSTGRPLAMTPVDELAQAKSDLAHLKTARERERASLLKLVIGMAVRGYGFNPTAARSPVPNEIAGDLALVGVPLDPDTVLKFLRAGAELLPAEPD